MLGQTAEGRDVVWPARSRQSAASFLLVASSGSGKSVLMSHLLSEEIRRDLARPPELRGSLFVCDIKGDLCETILAALVAKAPQTLDRVNYLQPFKGGFGLNLNHLERGRTPVELVALTLGQMIGSASTSAAQVQTGLGARQIDLMQHVLLGALAVPGGHPLLALDALTTPDGFGQLAALTESVRARRFLLGARASDEVAISTASRLRMALAASEALEAMVVAKSCIQWSEVLGPGAITLLDLSDPLGGPSTQTSYAKIILRLALEWANNRSSAVLGEMQHLRFVADEAQAVAPALADGTAEYTLSTGRSRGVSLGVATQSSALLRKHSESLWEVLLANAPTKIVGRLSASDAEAFARGEGPRGGSEESPGTVRARLAATIASLRDREFLALRPGSREKFRSVDVEVEAWMTAAAREVSTIREVKSRLILPAGPPRRTLADYFSGPPPDLPRPRQEKVTRDRGLGEGMPSHAPTPNRPTKKGRSRWG